MTLVRKFLFDNDFDASARRAHAVAAGTASRDAASGKDGKEIADPGPEDAHQREAIEAARKEGERAGREKGRAEAQAQHDRQMQQFLSTIAGALSAMTSSRQEISDVTTEAIQMGLAIARKLHPALAAQGGLAEAEAVLGECLDALKKEPRLVAYVAPAHLDALRERLDTMIAKAGYEGRIVLIGDDSMAPTDCRVEWADGGVERNVGQIWQEIEATLDRYCNASTTGNDTAGDDNGR